MNEKVFEPAEVTELRTHIAMLVRFANMASRREAFAHALKTICYPNVKAADQIKRDLKAAEAAMVEAWAVIAESVPGIKPYDYGEYLKMLVAKYGEKWSVEH